MHSSLRCGPKHRKNKRDNNGSLKEWIRNAVPLDEFLGWDKLISWIGNYSPSCILQWKLDLVDTSLAENLGLKDTLFRKKGRPFCIFLYISPLEIAENLVLAEKWSVTDFSAKSSFHCITTLDFSPKGHRQFWKPIMIFNTVVSYSNENFFGSIESLPFSFHQKREATKRGWMQKRPFTFEWNALIYIGYQCSGNNSSLVEPTGTYN